LCQPLAVAGSAPITGWLLGKYGWQQMLILEGILPFIWLPLWWIFIRDHPREAKWISAEEKNHIETILKNEAHDLEPPQQISLMERLAHPSILVMVALYFLHNCAVYGVMTFFTTGLNGQNFSPLQYGILFAIPYAVTAIIMVLISWSSDKMRERRGHVAAMYFMSGASLILSVVFSGHFWISYALMCLAIPGPFAAMAPFWAIPAETLPRSVMAIVMGIVNAFGNLGGFVGPYIAGWLKKEYNSLSLPFIVIGIGMLGCVALAFLLPKSARQIPLAATK
jgi:predicted MFS family arabinose efflux permease